MIVTSNLHDGLHQLASYTDIGYLLCDAICIINLIIMRRVAAFHSWGMSLHPPQQSPSGLETTPIIFEDFQWLHGSESMIKETFEGLG
jgi:hypothetical protein